MEETSQDIIKQLITIYQRRRGFIFIPFAVFAPLFATVLIFLPKTYYASTTILVEPQKISEEYVKPTVTTTVEDRLRTITQQMMSMTRLRKVLNNLNLIPDMSDRKHVNGLVLAMQENIKVEVEGKESFKIAFTAKDPTIAMKITNQIASLFIEENLKLSEQQAQSTTEFLANELLRVERQLKEYEEKLRDFKQKYMGELPDQLDANLRTLDRLQIQLQTTRVDLKDAQNQRILLEQQISEEKKKISSETVPTSAEEKTSQVVILQNLNNRLIAVLSRYSKDWPEVKRLEDEIARIEAQLKEKKELKQKNGLSKPELSSPVLNTFKINLASVKLRVANLQLEEKSVLKGLNTYIKRVENTPKREEELIGLSRDNEILRETYHSLLDKKLDAKLSENLEKKQKGENFIILDPAEIPMEPHFPKNIHVVMAGLGGGLAVCFLLVFASETLDHSFYDLGDVEKTLGFPVIGFIPKIKTKQRKQTKLIRQGVATFLVLVYLGVLGAIVINRNDVRKRLAGWGILMQSQII